MHSLHTVIFPLLTMFLAVFHIVQNQVTGVASPEKALILGEIPLYPDYIHRDMLTWIGGAAAIMTLVTFFPSDIGPKADPMASPPPGIRPEWYFLPLFQTIRMMPGTVGGINTEILVSAAVFALTAGTICLPWWDRGDGRMVRIMGSAFLGYCIVSIILAMVTT